jgi:hypothetical protein
VPEKIKFYLKKIVPSSSNSQILGLVQPSLKVHASELNSSIVKFGRTVEQLLQQHKRGIIGEYVKGKKQ